MKTSKSLKSVRKIRCVVCNGYGLVKRSLIVCRKCKGKKCMFCRETGFYVQPYEECGNCCGTGETEDE